MKTKGMFLSMMAAALLGGPAMAQAAAPSVSGQHLTQSQIRQYGAMQQYDIGSDRILVLPGREQPADGRTTQVINQRGVVGTSNHEVMVTRVTPAQIDQALQSVGGIHPLQRQHIEAAGITVLRFADFAQTMRAYQALLGALQGGTVTLPIQYGRPEPK